MIHFLAPRRPAAKPKPKTVALANIKKGETKPTFKSFLSMKIVDGKAKRKMPASDAPNRNSDWTEGKVIWASKLANKRKERPPWN